MTYVSHPGFLNAGETASDLQHPMTVEGVEAIIFRVPEIECSAGIDLALGPFERLDDPVVFFDAAGFIGGLRLWLPVHCLDELVIHVLSPLRAYDRGREPWSGRPSQAPHGRAWPRGIRGCGALFLPGISRS